jgi:hypothetical protein
MVTYKLDLIKVHSKYILQNQMKYSKNFHVMKFMGPDSTNAG